jgi:hypothetical protein
VAPPDLFSLDPPRSRHDSDRPPMRLFTHNCAGNWPAIGRHLEADDDDPKASIMRGLDINDQRIKDSKKKCDIL